MKAIIIAAGLGTRLRPLTTNRPKHLLEIGGKAILHRLLDQLCNIDDMEEIIVVVHYHADLIKNAIGNWYPETTKIKTVKQEKTNGTGDAVDTALREANISDTFIVVNGDVVFGENLSNFALPEGYEGLVVGAKVNNPSSFGVLVQKNKKLVKIIEKPENAAVDSLINAGYYVFPPTAVKLFANLGYSDRGEREMTDVLEQLVSDGEKIIVHPTDGGWFDVGHPWQILEANEYFMEKEQNEYKILSDIEPNVSIHGNVHIAQTARIRSGVYIEGPVYIDDEADIGPNCYIRGKTYLGKKTRVGNGCEIKNSIVYENTHAAHLSYVGDSILGRFCNLGAGTITANLRHDGKAVKMTIKENRVSTQRRKLGVIMGDNVKTGIGVNLLPGVKISSGSWLNAGDVISRDI